MATRASVARRGFRLVVRAACAVVLAATLTASATPGDQSSTCFGTVANGRLEGGVRLPASGPNFSSYSTLAIGLGRTWVHAEVRDIVVAAYADLAASMPDAVFVYGETGARVGGPFAPHRTHRNGTSVDFFVPVRDRDGVSVPLPTHAGNRWGYDIEFDTKGRFGELTLDAEALAAHLLALRRAAKARGADLAQVIFDPPMLPLLYATRHGAALKREIRFMPRAAWVRHDEHIHVDFAIRCRRTR